MTRKSVAFGLPWCTSGLKKVVFRRIHLRGSQLTRLEYPKSAKNEGKRTGGLHPGVGARRAPRLLVGAYFNIFPFG